MRSLKLRGRLLYGLRRAARRPSAGEAWLQGQQRELALELGPRRRAELLPKPLPLAESALQDARRAGMLLHIRKRRRPQPLDVGRLETEQEPRLVAAEAARVPHGEQHRQREVMLVLVEVRGVVGAGGPRPCG